MLDELYLVERDQALEEKLDVLVLQRSRVSVDDRAQYFQDVANARVLLRCGEIVL